MSNKTTTSCGHSESDAYEMPQTAGTGFVGLRWGCKECDAVADERQERPFLSLSHKLLLAKKARDASGVVLDANGFEVSKDRVPPPADVD